MLPRCRCPNGSPSKTIIEKQKREGKVHINHSAKDHKEKLQKKKKKETCRKLLYCCCKTLVVLYNINVLLQLLDQPSLLLDHLMICYCCLSFQTVYYSYPLYCILSYHVTFSFLLLMCIHYNWKPNHYHMQDIDCIISACCYWYHRHSGNVLCLVLLFWLHIACYVSQLVHSAS